MLITWKLQIVKGINPINKPIQKGFLKKILPYMKSGIIANNGINVKYVFIMKAKPIHKPQISEKIFPPFFKYFIDEYKAEVTNVLKIIS